MKKVRIKLIAFGYLPLEFQPKKVEEWKSSTFEVIDKIDTFSLEGNSDSVNWTFSDCLIKEHFTGDYDADFVIALVNVPIEEDYYTRVLGDNQIVFTFHEVNEILERYNIPLENIIYRLLYAYTLVYRGGRNQIPNFSEFSSFTHDETRGCLFDMNGIKTDLAMACHKPKICDECSEKLKRKQVSHSYIHSTQKDIKRIKKDLYYRILSSVKRKPIFSLFLSSLFAILLGVLSSVIGSFLI